MTYILTNEYLNQWIESGNNQDHTDEESIITSNAPQFFDTNRNSLILINNAYVKQHTSNCLSYLY